MLAASSLRRSFPGELLVNLVLRDIRSKFKRSTLGWLWSLITPLSTLAIYAVVFGVVFQAVAPIGDPSGLDQFALFLACGLLPWNFLASGMAAATGSIVQNEGLVKKVYFPRWVLPASTVISGLASFAVELLVLAVVLACFGNVVLLSIPMLLVVVALQAVFVLGFGLLLAGANAFFRDVQHFLAIVLSLWFYATPIVYPPDLPPEEATILGATIPLQSILQLNPMTAFVEAYRNLLYDVRGPELGTMLELLAWAVGAMVVGLLAFRRFEPRLAEEL